MSEGINGKQRWRMDRSFTAGNVITTLALIGVLIGMWYTMATRITVNETGLASLNARVVRLLELQVIVDDRQDDDIDQAEQQGRDDMNILNAKIDRLIDIVLGTSR